MERSGSRQFRTFLCSWLDPFHFGREACWTLPILLVTESELTQCQMVIPQDLQLQQVLSTRLRATFLFLKNHVLSDFPFPFFWPSGRGQWGRCPGGSGVMSRWHLSICCWLWKGEPLWHFWGMENCKQVTYPFPIHSDVEATTIHWIDPRDLTHSHFNFTSPLQALSRLYELKLALFSPAGVWPKEHVS